MNVLAVVIVISALGVIVVPAIILALRQWQEHRNNTAWLVERMYELQKQGLLETVTFEELLNEKPKRSDKSKRSDNID